MLSSKTVNALSSFADHEPPIDCLREMLRLFREGNVISVEFLLHAMHVVTYLLDMLVAEIDNPDDGLLVRGYGADEFDSLLMELYEELAGEQYLPVKSVPGIPNFLYMIIIRLLLTKLPEWLGPYFSAESIEKIVAAIQKVIDEILNK